MVFYGELCNAASGYTLRLRHTKTKIGEVVEDEANHITIECRVLCHCRFSIAPH